MRVTTLGGLSLGAVHQRALGATLETLEQRQAAKMGAPALPSPAGKLPPETTTRTSGQHVVTQLTPSDDSPSSTPSASTLTWLWLIGGAALGVGAVVWLSGGIQAAR